MTATATKKPATKPERSAKVTHSGDATILWLTVGKDVTAYRVYPLSAQFGAAFRLLKANKGEGSEEYDVLLDGNRSTCECRGFLRHGLCKDGKGCKHIAGLSAAIAAGSLQGAPKPISEPIELDDF